MRITELAVHRGGMGPRVPLRANRTSLRVNAVPDRPVLAGEGAG